MKQKQLGKITTQWGSHMNPEVSAETYLHSRDAETAQWAKEHQAELDDMDAQTANLYRRQRENGDKRSMEDAIQVLEAARKKKGAAQSQEDRWINEIYSKDPDELYQLVHSAKLAQAIQKLTPHQRRVIHMSAIREMKNSEIAKEIGTTARNVRDVLQRAYRLLKEDCRGEGDLATAIVVLCWVVLPTFMLGWQISKRIYPGMKRTVLKFAR